MQRNKLENGYAKAVTQNNQTFVFDRCLFQTRQWIAADADPLPRAKHQDPPPDGGLPRGAQVGVVVPDIDSQSCILFMHCICSHSFGGNILAEKLDE